MEKQVPGNNLLVANNISIDVDAISLNASGKNILNGTAGNS